MKPMSDKMYAAVLGRGLYCPMGAKRSGAHYRFLGRIHGACDRGVIAPAELAGESGYPMEALLTPILSRWQEWGLAEEKGGVWTYTAAGRYWYRTMSRILLRMTEYMLYGEKSLKKKKAGWGGMINMK